MKTARPLCRPKYLPINQISDADTSKVLGSQWLKVRFWPYSVSMKNSLLARHGGGGWKTHI